MIFACGIFSFIEAFNHLFNHAFFKALLFLAAGSIIHALLDQQDIRKSGKLYNILPITYISFLIGSLSLVGTPDLTGFYSKDIILETSYLSFLCSYDWSYTLGVCSTIGSLIYSVRLLMDTFFNINAVNINRYIIKETGYYILFVLVCLCLCSIVVGYLFSEIFQVNVFDI